MKLMKNRQDQIWFFRKIKFFTNGISIAFAIGIIVTFIVTTLFLVKDILGYVSYLQNQGGTGGSSQSLESFKRIFNNLLGISIIFPKSLNYNDTIFYLIIFFFIFRIIANLLYIARAAYDKKTIIDSSSILIVRGIKHIISIIFLIVVIVGFININSLFYTFMNNKDLNNIFSEFDKLNSLVNSGGGIDKITQQWLQENQAQVKLILDSINVSSQNLQNYLNSMTNVANEQTLKILVLISVGLGGLLLNSIILGITSIVMIRKYE